MDRIKSTVDFVTKIEVILKWVDVKKYQVVEDGLDGDPTSESLEKVNIYDLDAVNRRKNNLSVICGLGEDNLPPILEDIIDFMFDPAKRTGASRFDDAIRQMYDLDYVELNKVSESWNAVYGDPLTTPDF